MPLSLVGLVLGPFSFVWAFELTALTVRREADLVRKHGANQALWWSESTPDGSSLGLVNSQVLCQALTVRGWDLSGPYLLACCQTLNLGDQAEALAEQGFMVVGSWMWSKFILFLDSVLNTEFSYWTGSLLLISWVVLLIRRSTSFLAGLIGFLWSVCLLILFLPSDWCKQFLTNGFSLLVVCFSVDYDGSPLIVKWLAWRITALSVTLALALEGYSHSVRALYSNKMSSARVNYGVAFRVTVIKGVKMVSDVGLPEFIRKRFSWTQSLSEVQASKDLMAELGWPINVDIQDPVEVPESKQFLSHLIGGSSLRMGIKNDRTYIEGAIGHLRDTAIHFRRTEEYRTYKNELEATSRYFVDPPAPSMPVDLDMVWHVLGDIFGNSKLTPFNYVISKWVKKYALGFFMADDSGKRKMKRKTLINSMGYSNFKALWAKTFYYGSMILPVAHVSVKDESLPEKKWVKDKVRTVVGSPLAHYIMSTVFNYGPNHSFAWDTTPIKIGMPLNGYWMSRLFEKHARFSFHVQGDFEEFDSTLSGPVFDVMRGIRKRGYDFHKDKVAICELIDICYDQLDNQVLGLTSTGNMYRKGTGATTGHSSTSMDNSIALVTFYLMAWKELTGKSAREFLHTNELSCFGDDHVLSVAHDRPKAWSPKNITSVMAKWGVRNKVEVKPLKDISFLSKFSGPVTGAKAADFKRAGVAHRKFAIWHDRDRLLGKLTSKIKSVDPNYRATRLLSYLSLTCHHEDIYDGIVKGIRGDEKIMKSITSRQLVIPSYEQVVRDWYTASRAPDHNLDDEEEMFKADDRILQYGVPTLGDQFLGAISMVPDLLNPSTFNFGISRAIQSRLAPLLGWVGQMLAQQNNCHTLGSLTHVAKSTPYRFLSLDVIPYGIVSVNLSTMLLRHWLFLLYYTSRPTLRAFRLFDFAFRKIWNAQFILNGIVQRDVPTSDLHVDCVLVVALVGLISIPDWFGHISKIALPDVAMFVDLATNRLLTLLWSSVPANFGEVDHLLHSENWPLAIQAPTGTGKSTALVHHVWETCKGSHSRLVVVEPRTILIHGLVPYMRSFLGLNCTGGTSGMEFDESCSVWYVTPTWFFANTHRIKSDFIVILDEAHIVEPQYEAMKMYMEKFTSYAIRVSATLAEEDVKGHVLIDIPIAQIWTVDDSIEKQNSDSPTSHYKKWAASYVNALPAGVRAAVIVDTPEDARSLRERCIRDCQCLSSQEDPVVMPHSVYAATSVVDVGITLPDLDVIISPDWVYDGKSRVALNDTTRRQRRGRVGRVRNGRFVVATYNHFPHGVVRRGVDRAEWLDMIAGGMSPNVIAQLDSTGLAQAMGLASVPDDAKHWESVVAKTSQLVSNLRPILSANQQAEYAAKDGAAPVTLVPSHNGRFSGTALQPRELQSLLPASLASVTKWFTTDVKGDIYEVGRILSLLKELQRFS